MLLKVYVGNSSGKAKRVKKIYEGINNIAKLMYDKTIETSVRMQHNTSITMDIKKAYIGVNGVAQVMYNPIANGEISKYQDSITSLTHGKINFAATTVGNYAIFGGGYNGSYLGSVDTYTASLVKGTTSTFRYAKSNLGAASTGNYALFVGGQTSNNSSTEYVDTYTSELVKSLTSLPYKINSIKGISFKEYALFTGGYSSNPSANYNNIVYVYNSELVRTTTALTLTEGKTRFGVGYNDNYAIFAGGGSDDYISSVDAYNINLIKSSPLRLADSKNDLAGTGITNYALFGGGSGLASDSNRTWYYFNAITAYMDIDTYY